MHPNVRRGTLVGGLIALATIAPLVYDDYVMHQNGVELLRQFGDDAGAWLPLVHADFEVLLLVGLALVAFAAISWAFARGRNAWAFTLAGSVLAAITIVDSTLTVREYPGDATVLRVSVLPVLLAGTLVAALVLAYRHRTDHRPRLA